MPCGAFFPAARPQDDLKDEVRDMAKRLASAGLQLLVIDTENKFVSTGFAEEIAKAAQGKYYYLPQASGEHAGDCWWCARVPLGVGWALLWARAANKAMYWPAQGCQLWLPASMLHGLHAMPPVHTCADAAIAAATSSAMAEAKL
jgi:hypothetical protein